MSSVSMEGHALGLMDVARRAVREQYEIVLERGDSLVLEQIEWLWPNHVPLGQATDFVGDPGVGKTFAAIEIAARASTGGDWPDGSRNTFEPMVIVYFYAEDSAPQVLGPRFQAAGGDLSKVHFVSVSRDAKGNEISPSFPDDIEQLEKVLSDTGASLIILDPMYSFLSADNRKEQDVKQALSPLTRLLQKYNVAALLIRHSKKDRSGRAIDRAGGALGGVSGVVRSAFVIDRDPNDKTIIVMAPAKANWGPEADSLAYRIDGTTIRSPEGVTIQTARIVWLGASTVTADDMSAARHTPGPEATARTEAEAFLHEQLRDGPVASRLIGLLADTQGITESTLKRAKKTLSVTSIWMRGEFHTALPQHQQLGRDVPDNVTAFPGQEAAS